MPKAQQWVVALGFYEGSAALLIDQRTGRQTNLWGRPAVSPDGRYLLSVNSDLYAGYDASGLQLFRLTPVGPRLLGERQLTKWGPVQVRWSGAGTVLLEQEHYQLTDGAAGAPASTYVEMKLPESR